MSRLSDKEIMDLLVEEGLDKRIAENPEGAKQIANIVERAIRQRDSREEHEWIGEEYAEAVKSLLNDRVTPFDGYRYNDDIQISGDGSLSVKYKTDRSDTKYESIRRDKEEKFSVGEKNGGLVISQKLDNFSLLQDKSTMASKSLRFKIFNEKGLQLQDRKISKSAEIWNKDGRLYDIHGRVYGSNSTVIPRNCNEVFDVANELSIKTETKEAIDISPLEEEAVYRNNDMVTQSCRDSKKIYVEPVSYMDNVFEKYSKYDEMNYGDIGSRRGRIVEDVQAGTVFTQLGQSPETLYIPLDGNFTKWFEQYEKAKSEGRDETEKRRLYEEGCKYSPQFRATLLEQAKTHPELQKVIVSLALDGKVKTADLEKVYESVSDRDIKAQMDKIREASKDDKETDKKRESDGNPEL